MTDYRKDFPLLSEIGEHTVDGREWIYIDNAATSQRPQCVIDAERDFYLKHNANPLRGNYPLSVEATELYENARKGVRDFIGAKSAREIIFTRNTTESMNLVAYSYGLNNVNAGDEILVSIMEHHSNLLPWQMVARQTGAVLRFIECRTDGSVDLDQVKEQITEKTKIVAITQISNVLGRVNPVKEIAAMAHEKNAIIVVDGAQSTPHMPVNVQDLDADFFAFSGHKIFGPMGIGVLYGKKKLLKKMPPFLSGGEMIESVTRESAKYAELPHKFEAGTVNAAGAIALHAAIKYAQSVGFDTMQERELAVTKRAFDGLKELPHVHVLGSDRAEEHTGILTFTIDDVHPHDVSEILIADGICVRAGHHCAQPLLNYLGISSATRASFMFYNTEEEADKFVAGIASIRERMGYENRSFYNEILTEHNVRPEFKHDLPDADIVLEGVNPSCGDDIFLKLKTDGDTITDGAFVGDGCAISQASADIMLGMIVGKKKEEALQMGKIFMKMIKGDASEEEIDSLEEASALRDIAHMPARVKCAVLGWRTLKEALLGEDADDDDDEDDE